MDEAVRVFGCLKASQKIQHQPVDIVILFFGGHDEAYELEDIAGGKRPLEVLADRVKKTFKITMTDQMKVGVPVLIIDNVIDRKPLHTASELSVVFTDPFEDPADLAVLFGKKNG